MLNGTSPIARPPPRRQFFPISGGNATTPGLATNSGFAPASMKGATGIKGLLRDSLIKNRNESFKELMQFNLDTEFAKAERNLNQVNAT